MMPVLSKLDSYSESELERLAHFSSAFSRYKMMLQQPMPQSFADQLRRRRHQAWMECAAAEFFERHSTEDICQSWSQTADEIVRLACDHLGQIHFSNFCLLALGKWGAEELNLSSDIDLILISNQEDEQAKVFLRELQGLLSHSTTCGFVFRTDFDLRPGGRMGPLVPTVDQFEDYYGNYGEAWERLAFVRMRPIWGSEQITQRLTTFAQKFSYRRHLDYTLMKDLQQLRQRIHSQHGHRSTPEQMDLKLGLGGIRDLELFVHTLQVIHGGKDLSMRQQRTSAALRELEKKELLPKDDIHFLNAHYWSLRHWENLVQIENDLQTHLLITQSPAFQSHQQQLETLKTDMHQCDHIVSSLLGRVSSQARSVPENLPEQIQWLRSLGFSQETVEAIWPNLINQTVFSRQKERDENDRQRFLYLFIEEISRYPETQNRSLSLLQDFLKSMRAKATFFSLFLNQESLVAQVARIFANSPYLAGLLISRPELLDSFVFRSQQSLNGDDPQEVLSHLSEKKLLSELINGFQFLNSLDLPALISRLTETADEITQSLLKTIDGGRENSLLITALGKWGGCELGLRSDLDFIFLLKHEPQEEDLKKARRFFFRLTETHQRGGSLYSIDLRLRPSGKGGLVVTSVDQLIEYLSTEATAWERQAYLRARVLHTPELSKKIHQACIQRPLRKDELQELERIRLELKKKSQQSETRFDLKYSAGGFVDIELALQACILKKQVLPQSTQTESLLRQFSTENSAWNELIEPYYFLRLIEQLQQALITSAEGTIEISSENFRSLATLLQINEDTLSEKIRSALNEALRLLNALDPRRQQ